MAPGQVRRQDEQQGLEILPPDVNASAWRFEPVDPKRIRYGLGGIKGTGEQAIASAMRSAGAMKPGLPARVAVATNSTIDFFAAPSFHDASGSAARAIGPQSSAARVATQAAALRSR